MSTRVLTSRLAGHYVYVQGEPRNWLGILPRYMTAGTFMTMGLVGSAVWLLSSERAWPAMQDVIFFLQNI